mmetsp:Transcript_120942/g.342122  ORF Transcript_120942/g.342122 Transcript_120942/m.342122 type:complete len:217 (-) Transcript_120942:474-1124(-)
MQPTERPRTRRRHFRSAIPRRRLWSSTLRIGGNRRRLPQRPRPNQMVVAVRAYSASASVGVEHHRTRRRAHTPWCGRRAAPSSRARPCKRAGSPCQSFGSSSGWTTRASTASATYCRTDRSACISMTRRRSSSRRTAAASTISPGGRRSGTRSCRHIPSITFPKTSRRRSLFCDTSKATCRRTRWIRRMGPRWGSRASRSHRKGARRRTSQGRPRT